MIYKARDVCSREIHIEVDNELIKSVKFVGGCAGNGIGVSRLVQGMRIKDAIQKTEGIDCGGRGTSCPDQLAKALKELSLR